MNRLPFNMSEMDQLWESQRANMRVGRLVELNAQGEARVDFPGNPLGPIEARWAIGSEPRVLEEIRVNASVLLALENGDPTLPIIVGIVRSTLSARECQIDAEQRSVTVAGKTITFDATNEIVLRCGKSSVTLRSDGKVVVKGTDIVNRSSGVHKIRSGVVKIN